MSDPTITFVCTACLDKEKRIAVLEKVLDNLAVFLSVHGISVTDEIAKAQEKL